MRFTSLLPPLFRRSCFHQQVKPSDKDDANSDSSNPDDRNTVTMDDMELESQSEMDSKSSRESVDVDLKPSDLKPEEK